MSEIDPRSADLEAVRDAYTTWAPAYIDAFGDTAKASEEDRAIVAAWADRVDGPVLDAGCGPGHWTAYLHARGIPVEGIDATEGFVEHARRTHPGVPFRLGDLRDLDTAPGALGGVLAWFSTIHTDPEQLPSVLRGFARALRPGGRLLIGFFTGPSFAPFPHRVVTAWTWPLQEALAMLERAGLVVTEVHEQEQPTGRRTAAVVATRSG